MFTTLIYYPILVVSVVIFWLLPGTKIRSAYLCLVGVLYIYYIDRTAVFVVLGLTLVTYVFSYFIQKKVDAGAGSSFFHKAGVAALVSVLVFFKYLGLLETTINNVLKFFSSLPEINTSNLFVPLGLSYITLRYISYLTDIHWKVVRKGSLADLLLYGSLFTTFVAGPIDRFERIQPQINTNIKFSLGFIEQGFIRIVFGLAKKFILADSIGYLISNYAETNGDSGLFVRAVALTGYSLQIYFDFSGYSDIAIGSSKLFGLTIMENFNNPYLQPNISRFWRCWHISLSDWIRDYLFFPLSGFSNTKIWRLVLVPIIAMGICGMWHGAQFHFLVWGVWHGAGIAAYQVWNQFKRKNKGVSKFSSKPVFDYLAILITFIFVTVGWLFFN